jgi:hypothetical protein
MRYGKYIIIVAACLFFAQSVLAEEAAAKKLTYEERMKIIEDQFAAAHQAGKTVTGILVEGNSLFNGTTDPQNHYDNPYSKEQRRPVKFSAERNSKVFLLTKDGTLYYPTALKGELISQSANSPRIPRVLTDAQKKGPKLNKWATLVPLVGKEVEVYGEVYPGYAGIKGIYIESIQFEGDPQFDKQD